MPSLPESAFDERFGDLVEPLRAAKPRASEELRERIRQLALLEAGGPAPRRPRRRAALVLVPALLVAVVLGAALSQLPRGVSGGSDGQALEVSDRERQKTPALTPMTSADAEGQALSAARGRAGAGFAPAPGRRLQEYRAELRVRVRDLDELGEATQRAMRTTRSLGGYVVVADYGQPNGRDGDSLLVVRVPVNRVQDAIFAFSQLGTIASQRIRIEDLQTEFGQREVAIERLRRSIARLEELLRDPGLSAEERARLRVQLIVARQDLVQRLRAQQATLRRGRLARVALTLTTREGAVAKPDPPGYVERTLRDALSAVSRVVAWTLYVLIVLSPFVAIAVLALVLERIRRRRLEERLLSSA